MGSLCPGIGAGQHLNQLALRDHASQILASTVRDMNSPHTVASRLLTPERQHPSPASDPLDGAANAHAVDRLELGFDMLEVMSEYRALRASVLELWHQSGPVPDIHDVDDLTRFNESIDQSLSQAVASFYKAGRSGPGHVPRHPQSRPAQSVGRDYDVGTHLLPMVTEDKAEIVECGDTIIRSASVMDRMINDLLDYTRTRLGAGCP